MSKIFISGHQGMVGSSLVRIFQKEKPTSELVLAGRNELDLLNQSAVEDFIKLQKPDIVINAAAKVGGIHANNTYPAEFIHQNLLINTNLIHAAWQNGVGRFLNLGSSCIYPRACSQPINEEYLLTGPLEKTNEAYALAKIAGLKCAGTIVISMASFFIVLCLPIFTALEIIMWARIPMFYRHLSDGFMKQRKQVWMKSAFGEPANQGGIDACGRSCPRCFVSLGIGKPARLGEFGHRVDHAIQEIAELVKVTTGFDGEILNDTRKPDGMPVKRLDVSQINTLGWKAAISLEQGVLLAYEDFLKGMEAGTTRL